MPNAFLKIARRLKRARDSLFEISNVVVYRGDVSPGLRRFDLSNDYTFGFVWQSVLADPLRREELRALGTGPQVAAKNWSENQICSVVKDRERIVAMHWMAPQPTFESVIGRTVMATNRRWYAHHLVVLETRRRNRLAVALMRWSLMHLASRGAEGIYGLVHSGNLASHKTMRHSGLWPAGRIVFCRLGAIHMTRYYDGDKAARGFFGL